MSETGLIKKILDPAHVVELFRNNMPRIDAGDYSDPEFIALISAADYALKRCASLKVKDTASINAICEEMKRYGLVPQYGISGTTPTMSLDRTVLSPKGDLCANCSGSYVQIIAARTMKPVFMVLCENKSSEVVFSPDSRFFALMSGNVLQIWDVETQTIIYSEETEDDTGSTVSLMSDDNGLKYTDLVWSADSQTVVFSDGFSVYRYRLGEDDSEPVFDYEEEKGYKREYDSRLHGIAVSDDGKSMLIADKSCIYFLSDDAEEVSISDLGFHMSWFKGMYFTNGVFIVLTRFSIYSFDGTVFQKVRDFPDDCCGCSLTEHARTFNSRPDIRTPLVYENGDSVELELPVNSIRNVIHIDEDLESYRYTAVLPYSDRWNCPKALMDYFDMIGPDQHEEYGGYHCYVDHDKMYVFRITSVKPLSCHVICRILKVETDYRGPLSIDLVRELIPSENEEGTRKGGRVCDDWDFKQHLTSRFGLNIHDVVIEPVGEEVGFHAEWMGLFKYRPQFMQYLEWHNLGTFIQPVYAAYFEPESVILTYDGEHLSKVPVPAGLTVRTSRSGQLYFTDDSSYYCLDMRSRTFRRLFDLRSMPKYDDIWCINTSGDWTFILSEKRLESSSLLLIGKQSLFTQELKDCHSGIVSNGKVFLTFDRHIDVIDAETHDTIKRFSVADSGLWSVSDVGSDGSLYMVRAEEEGCHCSFGRMKAPDFDFHAYEGVDLRLGNMWEAEEVHIAGSDVSVLKANGKPNRPYRISYGRISKGNLIIKTHLVADSGKLNVHLNRISDSEYLAVTNDEDTSETSESGRTDSTNYKTALKLMKIDSGTTKMGNRGHSDGQMFGEEGFNIEPSSKVVLLKGGRFAVAESASAVDYSVTMLTSWDTATGAKHVLKADGKCYRILDSDDDGLIVGVQDYYNVKSCFRTDETLMEHEHVPLNAPFSDFRGYGYATCNNILELDGYSYKGKKYRQALMPKNNLRDDQDINNESCVLIPLSEPSVIGEPESYPKAVSSRSVRENLCYVRVDCILCTLKNGMIGNEYEYSFEACIGDDEDWMQALNEYLEYNLYVYRVNGRYIVGQLMRDEGQISPEECRYDLWIQDRGVVETSLIAPYYSYPRVDLICKTDDGFSYMCDEDDMIFNRKYNSGIQTAVEYQVSDFPTSVYLDEDTSLCRIGKELLITRNGDTIPHEMAESEFKIQPAWMDNEGCKFFRVLYKEGRTSLIRVPETLTQDDVTETITSSKVRIHPLGDNNILECHGVFTAIMGVPEGCVRF